MANAEFPQKQLHFLQPISMQTDTYILSNQLGVMRKALDLALSDYKKNHKNCNIKVIENFSITDEGALFQYIKKESLFLYTENKIIIGINRSNFARIAAKAAEGSNLIGISSAAFTDELKKINPRFLSVSLPWQKQWEQSKIKMNALGCTSINTLGIFTYRDVLSKHFKKGFNEGNYYQTIHVDDFVKYPSKALEFKKCIYMGTSLPGSLSSLTTIYKHRWNGFVIGMGDWTFYTPEMKEFLKRAPERKFRIFASLVWEKTENRRTEEWVKVHFLSDGNDVEPVTIGIYDSAILALNFLCNNIP